jgi:hypothetical protein
MLLHNVFFLLKDNSPAAQAKLIAACNKYLATHSGIVFFACGPRAEELSRDVNDLDFTVGLHIAFENQAAHDRYQEAPLHHQFIEENRANWAKVRVFDSTAEKR